MVIVHLQGGLGNQIFQYAAGRQLAINQGSELRLDLSWFKGDQRRRGFTPRRFLLDRFAIVAGRATRADASRIRLRAELRRIFRFGGSKSAAEEETPWLVERSHFVFDPRVLRAHGDTYLHGYWQNERYFAESSDLLRDELRLRQPPDSRTDVIRSRMANSNSVAIHVRRGDYLEQADAPRSHRVCGADYYHECLRLMVERVDDPRFFIFSDDPEWVARNILIPGNAPFEIVTHNDEGKAHEDLMLISACRHQILSNSTFGWWGAWLNPNPDKIVIGPERWFRGDVFDTSELLPPGWLRV